MLAILTALSLLGSPQESREDLDFFESKIRPVLVEKCYRCHNSVHKKKADLALDYRDGLLSSGVVVPGAPEKSPIIAAIRHEGDQEPMPFQAPKLAKIVIKNFEEWIRRGAPDPRVDKPTAAELERAIDWNAVREDRKKWWAFQPIKVASPPSGEDPDWSRTPIDRFIHAGIREAELEPGTIAEPGTLARRLHLILTGLPPKPEVVEAFASNPSDEAYEQLVDQLLDSRHYGERWARYWMDWYRYSESHGSQGDPRVPYATRYRDYLIRAMNSDVPYDQLIREHLAGDLLERPRIDAELGLNESVIGLGHFRMVPHGFGVTDAYDDQITVTDNQIDVISKAMLGLTVSCARCHNHKFDPISQEDYYRFYGIMVSSRPGVVNVDTPELQQLHREELTRLKEPIRQAFARWWLDEVDRAMERLETIGRWMRCHARSIYGCGPPPQGVVAPRDCRYTYNAKTNRLYLHIFTWPFKAVHLDGMADRVIYAQLLNDASEIQMRDQHAEVHAALNAVSPEGALTLELPVQPPGVEVPVVELFLK